MQRVNQAVNIHANFNLLKPELFFGFNFRVSSGFLRLAGPDESPLNRKDFLKTGLFYSNVTASEHF